MGMIDANIIIPSLITGLVTALGSVLGFIATKSSDNKKLKAEETKAQKAQEEKERKQIEDFQKAVTKNMADLEKSMHETLELHKKEYVTGITEVKEALNETNKALDDLRAHNQEFQAVVELKIDALEKKQDLHNNVITRVFCAEKEIEVLKNRESVSEHRLTDAESDIKRLSNG